MQRRFAFIDGITISYLEQGQARAGSLSLLLLHGLMGCADTFVPMMAALPPDLHVIALDMPGAGCSERRRDFSPRLAALARTTADLLKHLGLSAVCLCGHSHGGAVAMQMAQMYPDLVKSLVLAAPAHPYFDEGDPLIRFYLSLPGRMFAYTLPWFPRWMQMIGLRRMAGPKSWDTPERLTPYRTNLQTPGTMRHLLELLRTWHDDMAGLRRLLRKPVRSPVLVVWGDSDRAVPLSSSRELIQRFNRYVLRILPGVGHRPAEERPEEMALLVGDWVHGTLRIQPAHKPNSSVSQAVSAALMTPSFGSGD